MLGLLVAILQMADQLISTTSFFSHGRASHGVSSLLVGCLVSILILSCPTVSWGVGFGVVSLVLCSACGAACAKKK